MNAARLLAKIAHITLNMCAHHLLKLKKRTIIWQL